jgi:hypothetical protein
VGFVNGKLFKFDAKICISFSKVVVGFGVHIIFQSVAQPNGSINAVLKRYKIRGEQGLAHSKPANR